MITDTRSVRTLLRLAALLHSVLVRNLSVDTARRFKLTFDAGFLRDAVATSLKNFGKIDVWISNAGYGAFGPVEASSRAQLRRQYDVNVFGLTECVQAIAPHFRKNRSGVLINVTSIGGPMTPPGYAI